jgi:hypothetical protein
MDAGGNIYTTGEAVAECPGIYQAIVVLAAAGQCWVFIGGGAPHAGCEPAVEGLKECDEYEENALDAADDTADFTRSPSS